MAISKKIHYCWFGGKPLPDLAHQCIESWGRFCPDFEIIEWNEENYDISSCQFMKQAYERGKWAFVSDYARLDIVYKYGGIYLDTDVELIKSLDDLLDCDMFMGFEDECFVASGLGFGAQKGHPYLKEMMKYYEEMVFPDDDRKLSLIACPCIQTEVLKRHGLVQNGENQRLKMCNIYAKDYFAPTDFQSGLCNITSNTYSIHHYNMSWVSEDEINIRNKEWELVKRYPSKRVMIKIVLLPWKIKMHYKRDGIRGIFAYFHLLLNNVKKNNL